MLFSGVSSLFCTLGLASLALSAAVRGDAAVKSDEASSMQVVPSCNLYYRVQNGDTCWDIISRNANTFTIQQLLCWNPDINPSCSNLIPGRDICVGVDNSPYCGISMRA